jgi:hypothetical protein
MTNIFAVNPNFVLKQNLIQAITCWLNQVIRLWPNTAERPS